MRVERGEHPELDAADFEGADTEMICDHCGHDMHDFSDLGCEYCDARHPYVGRSV
jgi:hypothetical protein